MNNILKKPVHLALILTYMVTLFVLVAPASASTVNTARVETPAWEWEAKCITMLWRMELVPAGVAGFSVKEYPERDPAFRFEHVVEIGDYMTIMYFDDGAAAFNSAVLTVNLDKVTATEPVWRAINAVVMAGDPQATGDLVVELINAICPAFEDVLTGKERLNGAQGGTLHGIGYMMELNDTERFARFFANAELTRTAAGAPADADAEYYTLGADKVTSITKIVGARDLVKSDTVTNADVTTMTMVYSTDPNDHTQAANDMAKFFQYLMANDGFIPLKSFDGLPYEGGVEMQFAKESVDAGKLIILDMNYNSKGYTLIFTKGTGTLTRR